MPSVKLAGLRRAAAVALASLLTAAAASGQTPLTSGAFTSFGFGGVGSAASGQPFTYTSATPFSVTVLDGFFAGDQFQLFDGTTLIGTTNLVPTILTTLCGTPAACLADARLSRGTFALGAGSYNFNILTVASPNGSGSAWIGVNVVSTAPEPATLALLGTGLLGVAAARRRRTTA